jgi:hypothetical protein
LKVIVAISRSDAGEYAVLTENHAAKTEITG